MSKLFQLVIAEQRHHDRILSRKVREPDAPLQPTSTPIIGLRQEDLEEFYATSQRRTNDPIFTQLQDEYTSLQHEIHGKQELIEELETTIEAIKKSNLKCNTNYVAIQETLQESQDQMNHLRTTIRQMRKSNSLCNTELNLQATTVLQLKKKPKPTCPPYPPATCPAIPTCPTCPASTTHLQLPTPSSLQVVHPSPPTQSPTQIDRSSNTTPTVKRRRMAAFEEPVSNTQQQQESPKTHHPYDLSNWHEDISTDAVMFRKHNQLAGSINFVHLIMDFPIEDLMARTREICTNVLRKEIKKLADQDKTNYQTLLQMYEKKCQAIRTTLEDAYQNYFAGSESYMYNRYTQPISKTNVNNTRKKRQLLLMGIGLLALGIVAGASYMFTHMSLANLSVQSYTNPATIHTLEKHETRLNMDEEAIQLLRQHIVILTNQQTIMEEELQQLQYLFKIDGLLDDLHWQSFQLAMGFGHLYNGRLSPYLIEPKKLQAILRKFRENIKSVGLQTIITDTAEIYGCETSYLVFTNKTIRAITHIPAYKEDSLMDLYEFIPMPLTLNNQFVYIHPTQTYLAINPIKTLFRTMTEDDLGMCSEMHQIVYCKDRSFFSKNAHDSCLHSLFLKNEADIISQCPVSVSPPKEFLLQLSHDRVIIFHPKKQQVTLTCKMASPPQVSYTFKGFQQFFLFPGCRLETPNYVVEGTTNLFSRPNTIHLQTPDIFSAPNFKALASRFNDTSDLSLIHSQKALRIDDIEELFKNEATAWTWGIGLMGSLGFLLTCCIVCCCYYKVIRPCRRRPARRAQDNRREEHELRELPRRELPRTPEQFRNPGRRTNLFYPRN